MEMWLPEVKLEIDQQEDIDLEGIDVAGLFNAFNSFSVCHFYSLLSSGGRGEILAQHEWVSPSPCQALLCAEVLVGLYFLEIWGILEECMIDQVGYFYMQIGVMLITH